VVCIRRGTREGQCILGLLYSSQPGKWRHALPPVSSHSTSNHLPRIPRFMRPSPGAVSVAMWVSGRVMLVGSDCEILKLATRQYLPDKPILNFTIYRNSSAGYASRSSLVCSSFKLDRMFLTATTRDWN
jgi:hypothetical protein